VAHASRGGSRIEFGDTIVHFCFVTQSLEAMSEAGGDIEFAAGFRRQFERLPPAKSRRGRSNINNNNPPRPLSTAHELNLAMRMSLVVHSAQRSSLNRIRHAVLYKSRLQPVLRELIDTERSREETSWILCWNWLDEPSTDQRRLDKIHTRPRT